MIRIRRPQTEPAALRKQRLAGLKRAFAALNKHGAGSDELKKALKAYDGGKATLFRAQHRKCAYCGRSTGLKGEPLEHVRPKKEAWRHLPGESPRVVEPGYWWLTWAWKNHLFACQSCNTGFKGNHFPLAAGSATLTGPTRPYPYKRLRPEHLDVAVESSLFVDPSAEDPLDHIAWRPVNPKQPKRMWIWSPEGLSDEGKATIKVLHLDALADDVASHLRSHALRHTEAICAHVDAGRFPEALADWLALGKDIARSRCHLAGPTWSALHHLVEAHRRTKASLPDLPRP
jgi:5-methylcytosine-specific restriction endonuclease McrA